MQVLGFVDELFGHISDNLLNNGNNGDLFGDQL